MWCEQVIRNCETISPAEWGGRTVDWVDIEWNECGRVLKKQTRSGKPVRVLLPLGQRLRHNDVIYEDGEQAIAIHVLPREAIVARVVDAQQMALLMLELGNLHQPVQLEGNDVIFIEDGPAMAMLETMAISWTKQIRRFEPISVISAPSIDRAQNLQVIIRSTKIS